MKLATLTWSLISVIITLILTNCAILPIADVSDLKCISLEVVSIDTEIPCELFTRIKQSKIERKEYLQINLSSRRNLCKITSENDIVNVFAVARIEDLTHHTPLFTSGVIYLHGRSINGFRNGNKYTDQISKKNNDLDDLFVYQFYLPLDSKFRTVETDPNSPLQNYKIGNATSEVSFYISGGNMMLHSFKSNTIVVQKEMIMDALKNQRRHISTFIMGLERGHISTNNKGGKVSGFKS